ncbi:hypothetical protein COLO4_26363 [Corchorus olitorius]|uniref:Uncharacterized protein n=1 Tax=Corchorus olitorius TaxID=93759 RepID=A0A1R3HXF0_9ROSI|nr:hypothetical protein COLO4_26363 [Corchorus olitorius]
MAMGALGGQKSALGGRMFNHVSHLSFKLPFYFCQLRF